LYLWIILQDGSIHFEKHQLPDGKASLLSTVKRICGNEKRENDVELLRKLLLDPVNKYKNIGEIFFVEEEFLPLLDFKLIGDLSRIHVVSSMKEKE